MVNTFLRILMRNQGNMKVKSHFSVADEDHSTLMDERVNHLSSKNSLSIMVASKKILKQIYDYRKHYH